MDVKLVECSVPSSPQSNIVFPIVSTVSPVVVHDVVVECRRFGRVQSSVIDLVEYGRVKAEWSTGGFGS